MKANFLIKSIFLLAAVGVLSISCKGKKTTVNTFKGTWKPGTVLLNNTGVNLASAGQQYEAFTLTFDGNNDNSGTYSISGMPQPFGSFSGSWTRTGATVSLGGAPQGISVLTNFNVSGSQMFFVMEQSNSKVGTLVLHFALNKQ